MKRLFFILFPAIIFFGVANGLTQFYEKSQYSGVGIPFFEVELFRTFSQETNKIRLIIYNEILNDDLTFVKSDTSGFSAEFEFVFAVIRNENEQVASRTIKKMIAVTDYSQTNSREEKTLLTNEFDIDPDEYVIKMQMNDLNSKKTTNRQMKLNMADFVNRRVNLSDILLVQDFPDNNNFDPLKILPQVKTNFQGRQGKLYIYFDLYFKNPPGTVQINYVLENKKEEKELDTTITREIDRNISSHTFMIDKIALKKSEYICIVTAKFDNEIIERRKNFSFYWVNFPETNEDISVALRQMMYILPEDSLDVYREAPLDTQKTFFKRFWAERDPNPNTEINELLEEYYRRVNYSNREYSSFNQDGWRSDRGRILIKFGFPDDVERHPFEIDSVPYEIWRYYSLRKVFIFTDRSGFGDYRLLPQYMDQEYH